MSSSSGGVAVAVGVLMASFLIWLWFYDPHEMDDEVGMWLRQRDLGYLRPFSPFKQMNSLRELAELDLERVPEPLLSSSSSLLVLREGVQLLQLELWLREEEMEELLPQLVNAGHSSIHSLLSLNPYFLEKLVLQLTPENMAQMFRRRLLSMSPPFRPHKSFSIVWTMVCIFAGIVCAVGACFCGLILFICVVQGSKVVNHTHLPNPVKIALSYKIAPLSSLEWNHDDNVPVGGASVATLHLVSKGSTPYSLQSSDVLTVEVKHILSKDVMPHVVEPATPTNHSQLRLSFTTKLTGTYSIDVKLNGQSIAETPVLRTYVPGPVDPAKTSFRDQPHWCILTAGTYHSMTVVPRDSFGNSAIIKQHHLTVNIRKGGPGGDLVNPECVVERIRNTCHYELLLKVETTGYYIGSVLYQGETVGRPQFTIISLSRSEAALVDKSLNSRNVNLYYEACLTEESRSSNKKVYCYLYPKQFQVREYYLKLIPYRLFTCKVCPTTTIRLHEEEEIFTVDDGYQPPITLRSRQREVIAATLYKFILRNIGGSEQFQDKRKFFQAELRSHHSREHREEKHLTVDRFHLLDSAMKATRGFTTADWLKSFSVTFRGEEALDWGGVSREFFHLLCTKCFNGSNGMFMRFKDDPQSLVHLNPHHPPSITSQHYKFAGRLVGKCLYESCHDNHLLVSARFTRSFLALIIGLRINYKYFETDDPDLYVSKVQYIREHNVNDLELVFAEEEFSDQGKVKVIPLVDHGESKPVTEENKIKYLNLLAQHRLSKQIKTEMDHFMKGLNELVPEHLLGIFDENELELLICGTETVSYSDLKKHAVVTVTGNQKFQQVISWFWLVVSGFTAEEMARLLQFVTGSSQLPTGGFKELNPKFLITSAPTHGRLPSAHTCFNQLCLPEYDSCEQLQHALKLALNEGTEGFGFL